MDKTEAPKVALDPIVSLFGGAWRLYKERWPVLVEILLLPTLIMILGAVLIMLDLGGLFRALGGLIVFLGWVVCAYSILPVVYSIHNRTGVDASYKATIGWFWPYMWMVILQMLALVGASVMLVIPGIWLDIALGFVVYAFVIERRRGIDALRQSKNYVKGYWWAVLGKILLLAVIYIAAIIILQMLALAGGKVLSGLASAVLVLFFVPFAMTYTYLIFQNLRALKPGLAEAQMKEGTGFIKASAIVGIVVPVLFVILGIVFAAAGAFYMMGHANLHYIPPPGYVRQVPSMQQ